MSNRVVDYLTVSTMSILRKDWVVLQITAAEILNRRIYESLKNATDGIDG